MVERQYEILRKERIKGAEEQKSRAEEPVNTSAEPTPAGATVASDDSQPQQEV